MLNAVRAESEKRFAALETPTQKDENYRYTSLKGHDFKRAPKSISGELNAIPHAVGLRGYDEAGLLVVRSGGPEIQRLTKREEVEGQNVVFQDLTQALKNGFEPLREHLDCPEALKGDAFANLVAARAQNGVVIFVPKNAKVLLPLRGVHWFDEASDVFFHRTILVAGENSEITYIDEFASDGHTTEASPIAYGLVEIVAGSGAKVHYVQAQNWGRRVHHYERKVYRAARDATINVSSIEMGGEKGQVRCESLCEGRGSTIKITGAAKGEKNQHCDFWVTARHTVPETQSGLEFWTVLKDQARFVFNANIVITKEAVKTDAFQKNKNLLLSPTAVVDTIPKLEIATDDVKCAHGASVSSVNPDQLYYLQARGLSRPQAEAMIVNGFTDPVLHELPTQGLKEKISGILHQQGLFEDEGADE